MTNKQAPAALRLAEELEHDPGINRPSVVAELRRLHAENVTLQHGYDAARMEIEGLRDRVQELGAMLRENRSKRIVELEAQIEAIGAGGVEPLRRRECLHQIVEPAPAAQGDVLAAPAAVARQPLTRQQVIDRFGFLEGIVNEANFLRIVDEACALAPATQPAPAAQGDAEDAMRYRWLRDVGDVTWVPLRIRTGYSAAQVDEAIDATRKQGGAT